MTKLDPTGARLAYSTFLGGSHFDIGNGIAIDARGSAYVTGYTGSPGYPTAPGAFDTSNNGDNDAFVTKLDLDSGPGRPPCTVAGSSRNDVLVGTPGDDVICAGAGNDVVRAGGGNDTVYGRPGNDDVRAEAGDDAVYGGPVTTSSARAPETTRSTAGRATTPCAEMPAPIAFTARAATTPSTPPTAGAATTQPTEGSATTPAAATPAIAARAVRRGRAAPRLRSLARSHAHPVPHRIRLRSSGGAVGCCGATASKIR